MPDVGGIAGDRLKSFIERIERLEEEKKALADDIKEVYAEAKGTGFDTKTMRQLIKLRKMDKDDLDEQEALLDIYKAALGMLNDTPLGEAAIRRITSASPSRPSSPSAPAAAPSVINSPTGGSPGDDAAAANGAGAADDEAPGADAAPREPEDTVEDARRKGAEAAAANVAVTANPYPARDPRRAAWDEAWCAAADTDGMEIPAFLRRKKPGKPAAPEEPAAPDQPKGDAP
jgi:uncharacterized protein (UPF0335 family)